MIDTDTREHTPTVQPEVTPTATVIVFVHLCTMQSFHTLNWSDASVRCSGSVRCSRVTAARCPHAPAPPAAEMMCGAPSATQPATAETQAIADKVKSQLEEKENKKFPVFKALEFKSQLVAGKNYFIKVQVDEDDFMHIRVFESLPHENKPVALTSYQTNKGRHDELTYF